MKAVTAEDLSRGLVEYDLITDDQLIHALGASRDDISLNDFELAIVREHLISDERLLELKGTLSGYPILDDHTITALDRLPDPTALATGALLINTSPVTVAMVEPTQENIDALANALGTPDFSIFLTTATSFALLYRATYLHDESVQRYPVPKEIFDVMTAAVQRNASDIHLSIGQPPIIRQDGNLIRLSFGDLDAEWMNREIPKLVGLERFSKLTETFDIDTAFTYGTSRFRVNIGMDFRGPTVSLRKIPVRVPSLDELGLPPSARNFIKLERGLVLVTGPTGSGKSTTIASMLAAITAEYQRHVITLEDPIEYHIPSGKSVVNQRELYDSFSTFPNGLRQALRQDPDVILVGELRDLETMRTALSAAETGHLVLATMHTYDAVATVSRLVSSFPAEEQDHARAQLAYILKGVISQTLLPTAHTAGRVAAYEIMIATPAIQANLAKHNGHNQLRQTMEVGKQSGMQTMEIALVDLVRRGIVKESEAEFRSSDRASFMRRLRG
jgi:twitching motility protein PilT